MFPEYAILQQDIKGNNSRIIPPTVPMTELEDHYLLDNKVRYYGEAVAAVVAVDEKPQIKH